MSFSVEGKILQDISARGHQLAECDLLLNHSLHTIQQASFGVDRAGGCVGGPFAGSPVICLVIRLANSDVLHVCAARPAKVETQKTICTLESEACKLTWATDWSTVYAAQKTVRRRSASVGVMAPLET